MSTEGLVVCTMPTVVRTRSGLTISARTFRIAAWVRPPSTLWIDVTAPSTALAIAEAGERRVKVEMRSPGFVDVDRDSPGVRHGGDAFEIGCDAAVGGADQGDEFRIRVVLQRRGDLLDRDAESDVELRMQPRREVDRDSAGQDQRHEHRLVKVASNDHLVAGSNSRQHEGVVAGGRAIEQKEAAIGVPGVGCHRFRDTKGFAAEVRVADARHRGDVAAKRPLAERLTQLFVRADTELVTGRRERNDASSAGTR